MGIRQAVLAGIVLAIVGILADGQPVYAQPVDTPGAVPGVESDMPVVSRGELRFIVDAAGFRD